MTAAVPGSQFPGIYRWRIGDAVVTAVNDGGLILDPALLLNIEVDEAKALLRRAGRPDRMLTAINTFVVQTASSTVLIDTGAGALMGADAGHLQANLQVAGVTPDAVDAVLLTHLHADHFGGLLTAQGQPAFPNADVHVSRAEAGFWLNEATAAAAPEAMRPWFEMVRRTTAPYGSRLQLFGEDEAVCGLQSVPLYGHTPGHTGYSLHSGEDRLLIWGDVFHMPDVQSRHPEAAMTFDSDPAMSIASRRRALDMAASERLLVAGMHLHFPGFARIVATDGAYQVQPVTWQPTL